MSSRTVLVIDDEAEMRDLIREVLEVAGFRVLLAETGAAGLETARGAPPDLVVCDIVMPGLDGYAVLEALRRDPRTAATPFIFLTAQAERTAQRRGMESGAEDYVTKPFAPAELVRSVRAQLAKRDAAARRSGEALDELRQSIARILSHELMTPLTVIIGYAGLLRRAGEAVEGRKLGDMAMAIEAGARMLERMVRNILFCAQLELLAGDPSRAGSPPEGHTDSVDRAIRDAAGRAAARFGRQGDLRLAVEDGPARIPTSHLDKIVEELVDNACKFSAPGAEVPVRAWRQGGELTISVTDRGRGMTLEQIRGLGAYVQFDRKLFEQQGLGLGLTVVKRAVELAGGRFEITSVPGQGTVATVVLPP